MPQVAVVVDSVCALPPQFMRDFHIHHVPITININGSQFPDPCDDRVALEHFESGVLTRKNQVSTEAPSVETFQRLLWQLIDEGYQYIWIQTVNRMQGLTYDHANEAAASVTRRMTAQRKAVIRVMDSRTVFAGQALLAAETVRRMQTNEDPVAMRRELDKLSNNVHTYVVPRSPLVALERSKTRGERGVKWSQALVANTLGIHPILCVVNDGSHQADKIRGFEKAAQAVFGHVSTLVSEGRLLAPIVTANYSGKLEELRSLKGFAELKAACAREGVQFISNVASLSGGIYGSVGSLMVAAAAEPHEWQRV
ncbi:DegV family protein [Salinispirillum sp. LH 10-3-1]|uniref:DegV family protein n=1 Tax=Salinispirillum sp. LH 10-3-1 TaxID=2952525 RepID=A0AB38YDD0_9GAMM